MSRLPLAGLILFAYAACASAQSADQAGHTETVPQDPGYVLFVGLESEDAVAIMDPQAGALIRKIPIGISTEDIEGVHALDVSPDGEYYYLSIAHGWPYGSVWKMSTQKDSLVGRTNVGLFPATMGITPDGTWLFVANYNLHGDPQLDTVSVVHTPTMTEVQQIPVCTKPHGLVVSNDGESVYVSCTRDNVLKRISVASFAVVDSTNMLIEEDRLEEKVCYPAGLALSRDDERLFIACHKRNEVRVMPTSQFGTITNRISVGKGPYLLRTDPAGERLYVPHRNDQSFSVIDIASEEVIATKPASASHPHTFAFGPDGRVFLSMESHAVVPGAVDEIDPETFETTRSVELGLQATGVGVVARPPSYYE